MAKVPDQTKADRLRAAGGIVWRRAGGDYQVALIHRARYGDWTLPKGKLEPGESWKECALREVREETGYAARLLRFAGALVYEVEAGSKVVRYWHMMAEGEPGERVGSEVDKVEWLSIDQARQRLDYPVERALLETWQSPEEEAK